MAWNEPGGNKDKNNKDKDDGWGPKKNNGQDDGPPDLEEVFSGFFGKFKALFGGADTSSGDFSPKHMIIPFILLACIYVAAGFFVVKPPEKAVITKFGKFESEVGQGLHWIPLLIKDKVIVNTETIRTTKRSGLMLTKDINLVSVTIEVQYRIDNIKQYLFNVRNPAFALDEASDSALRQVVGHSNFDYIISVGKEDIAKRVEAQIQETLNHYRAGIKVTTLALKEAIYPKEVESAFDDVTKAKEEREQLKHEAEAYANKIIPEAEGDAQKILELASAYEQEMILDAQGQTAKFNQVLPEYNKAPEITRKRIYLATMQDVLTNTSKILVDIPKGNNILYLPIDKISGQKTTSVAPDANDAVHLSGVDSAYRQTPTTNSNVDDYQSRRDRRRR